MKKRKLLLLTLILAFVAAISTSIGLTAVASTQPPSIDYATVVFDDAVDLRYFVKSDDAGQTKLLVWKGVPENQNFTFSTADEVLTDYAIDTQSVAGETYKAFTYDKVAAKQMGDTYYVCALYTEGQTEYYSGIVKYSIQQYAQNMKANYQGADRETLIPMLDSMLDYGAAAQTHFNYNADRLVNSAEAVSVQVVGGKIVEDGSTYGIYYPGDIIDLTAPETDGDVPFYAWKDAGGQIVETPYTVTGTEGAMIVTATYKFGNGQTPETAYIVATSEELQAAIDSMDNEINYIKLGNDITYNKTFTQEATDKPFVLDLDGKTLDGYRIEIYGTSTIKNGNVEILAGIYAKTDSNLTLTSLNISSNHGYGVSVDGGTVRITNTTIEVGNESALKAYSGTVNAYNVTLKGYWSYNIFEASVILDGEYKTGASTNTYHTHGDVDGDNICDWGKEEMPLGSGTLNDPFVVKNTTALQTVLNGTADITYISLGANITSDISLTVSQKPIVLDLKRYTLSFVGYTAFNIEQSATIKNGVITLETGNILLDGDNDFILEDLTVRSDTDSAVSVFDGYLIVTDCSLEGATSGSNASYGLQVMNFSKVFAYDVTLSGKDGAYRVSSQSELVLDEIVVTGVYSETLYVTKVK